MEDFSKAQGHWILARMGKKVLRPGGKELTKKLVAALNVSAKDHITEFAPGLGYTASLALNAGPASYIGVDADEKAVAFLQKNIKGSNVRFELGNAAHTGIAGASRDKVFGEAMLTMHADHRKTEIIKEAHRILKKGGLYAIHELGLQNADETLKAEIQKDLALAIKVNARPLAIAEWSALLEKEGFAVKQTFTNSMYLLEPGRIINDEGFFRTLKIGLNILLHPAARKRIVQMRRTFKKHQQHMNAVVIIAEKQS